MGITTFTFGEGDDKLAKKDLKFKCEGGKKYIISFPWFPQKDPKAPSYRGLDFAAKPLFTGGPRGFVDKVGYVVIPSKAELKEAAKYMKNEPKMYGFCPIVNWPVTMKRDKSVVLDEARIKEKDYGVEAFIISGDKYTNLTMHAGQSPLGSNDIIVTCENTEYQKMSFVAKAGNLFRQFAEAPENNTFAHEVAADIWAQMSDILANIEDHFGKTMTLQELRDSVAKAAGRGGPSSSAADVPATQESVANVEGALGLLG